MLIYQRVLFVTDFRGKIFCSPDMGNCGDMNSDLPTCCLSEAHHFFRGVSGVDGEESTREFS